MNWTEAYPYLLAQWHPSNGNLNPVTISSGSSRKKIWWKCPVANDHVWAASLFERISGRNCPYCANLRVARSNCLATTHPDIAAQWHASKNGNITPNDITGGHCKKKWWQCSVAVDHQWLTTPKSRTEGRGCPYCAGTKVARSNCLSTTHPTIAKEWHPTKNGNITPSEVSAGQRKRSWWLCSNGHEWAARIDSRTVKKSACPVCNESKGETTIAHFLEEHNIPFKRQHRFRSCKDINPLPFDFVINTNESTKIIEYQGRQHYEPVPFSRKIDTAAALELLKKHDEIKKKWCDKMDIQLLQIPYWELANIPKIVHDFIG